MVDQLPTVAGDAGNIEVTPVTLFSSLGVDGLGEVADAPAANTLLGRLKAIALAAGGVPSGGATAAKQDTIIGHVDGIETALAAVNASLDAIEAVAPPMTSAQFLTNLRSTGTHSFVNSSDASVTILAANANRKGARFFNTDVNAAFVDLSGGTAVAASRAQVKLATDEGYEVPAGCTGEITCIWAADGAGGMSVVEFA